jgi:hypothetical protein
MTRDVALDHFVDWWRSQFSGWQFNAFQLGMRTVFDFATNTTSGTHRLLAER